MRKLIEGILRFQTEIFSPQRELFQQLAEKRQTPGALFITCSDSRVNPNLLTQTEPGELFILRNAGNIIPPYGSASGGEGATIEYAVAVLGIKNIIVCGHSRCGAMHELIHNENIQDLPAVAAWFAHAETTRRILRAKYGHLNNGQLQRPAIEENVLVQLGNLRTHPAVAAALRRDELHLYGWVYRIETGEVLAYDPEQGRFLPINGTVPKPLLSPERLVEGDGI
jgi:carbonic anhydrase